MEVSTPTHLQKRGNMATAAAEPLTKRTLENNLIEKCWKDPQFREDVLKDPKGMFEAYIGKSLPPDFKVIIHEEDANTLHLAIPPAPSNVTELSDDELERVAGGTEVVCFVTVLAGAVTASVVVTGIGGGVGTAVGGW